MAAILLTEEAGSDNRLWHFIQVPAANRQAALFEGQHKDENAEILFQEMGLGFVTNYINIQANLGYPERLGPMAGPGLGATGAAGGAAATGMEPAGRYDQAFLARKMQAEDMKNAKQFLQMGPLSAATIEQFDQWRDNITRAACLINLTDQAYWATNNRLIEP